MSEEEENNAQQPPAPPKRPKLFGLPTTPDAHLWARKWSTWLGVAAAGSAGALGVYAMSPERAQATVPEWALMILIGIGMVAGFGVGVATSIQQKVAK